MEKQSYELINGIGKHVAIFSIVYDGRESLWMFFIRLRSKVQKIVNLHPEIDVIHLNDGLMATIFYLLKIPTSGIKIVVTFHGLDVVFPLGIFQNVLLPKLHQYDAFVCVSDATRQACLDRGFQKDKLFIVDNGVEDVMSNSTAKDDKKIFTKYGIKEDDIIILAIGRPVKRKGFSWFAKEVIPLLGDKFKFVHIGEIKVSLPYWYKILPIKIQELMALFLGKATDAQPLIDAARSNSNIILCGKVSEGDKIALISKARMTIMPNIKVAGDMEGFGLVALEAAVQGKTVLAAHLEGITNAIHDGRNGYLIPSEQALIWKEKIMDVCQDEVYYIPSVRKYTLDHFSWEIMCNNYAKIFINLV